MKLKAIMGIILTLLLMTTLALVFNIQSVKAQPLVASAWLTFPITLDGKMTTAEEWSNTYPINITLLEDYVGPRNVSATIWMKNDDTWLYILYKVPWSAGDTHPFDSGAITFARGWSGPPPPLWDYTDLGSVRFDNETFDYYGYNETSGEWHYDTAAFPPGENNVEGAATHDGTYYWFEFRKELDSGDGYDWKFAPGQYIATIPQYRVLSVFVYDHNAGNYTIYASPIDLLLLEPPDLIVTEIGIPDQLDTYINHTIKVYVLNNGTTAAGPYSTNLTILYIKYNVTEHSKRETIEHFWNFTNINEFYWIPKYAGVYRLTAFADCDDNVTESNEANNELSIIVEVQKTVGGVWVPVDKLSLLAPYIGLVSTILVATAATAIYVKRRRKKQ